jgi:Hemolysins and related proteins containing CBS domains
MDTNSLIIIFALVILISISAYFSMSEMAFASLNRIRLKNLAKDGNKRAEKALAISDNFDKMLTTILIGNNVVNLLASSLCTMFFINLMVNASSDFVPSVVSTLVITLLILVFGEITPKCIAKEKAESVAMAVAPSISKVVWAFTPISVLFLKLKSAMTRRLKKDDTPTITEEELIVMIDEIEEEGTLEKHESELIKSAIEFDDIMVNEIFTPRVDIKGVDVRADRYEIKYMFTSTGFSRLLVYDETVDRAIGVLYVKDFYNQYFDSEEMTINDILRPVKFVPESTKVSSLLSDLQKAKTHMAVVLDSYGGTMGIVTLEDIVEELVGEIWDESDEIEYAIVKEDDHTYSVLGGANVYDVMDELEIRFDPEEYEDHSVGGYVQYILDRIPVKGDTIDIGEATISVKSTKNRRVHSVRIIKKQSEGIQE